MVLACCKEPDQRKSELKPHLRVYSVLWSWFLQALPKADALVIGVSSLGPCRYQDFKPSSHGTKTTESCCNRGELGRSVVLNKGARYSLINTWRRVPGDAIRTHGKPRGSIALTRWVDATKWKVATTVVGRDPRVAGIKARQDNPLPGTAPNPVDVYAVQSAQLKGWQETANTDFFFMGGVCAPPVAS